jgi:hypothetical protein
MGGSRRREGYRGIAYGFRLFRELEGYYYNGETDSVVPFIISP